MCDKRISATQNATVTSELNAAMMLRRTELEELRGENTQLLLQLSQDKLDIAELNKR